MSLGGGLMAAPQSKTSDPPQTTDKSKPAQGQAQAPANAVQADRGEQVFTTNCVRCHTPPGGLTQRVTGTVIMHMRVRARLSREDEQALLRFLAP
jgi:mono/diheme cytochrome c family protein